MPQAVVAVQAFIYGTVGTAAAAAGASSALAASIATAAVTVATATAKVALLAGLNAVVANQNRPRPQGGLINLTINPSEPRRLQVGKRINGGVLSDWYVGGAKNGELFMIVYLGEGPMGQITKVYGGGREVYGTPLVHGTRTEIPAYRSVGDRIPGRLWITYYDGRPGQTADSYLVGKGLGWTTNHIGTGCAYAIIEAWWDSDNQTTPPQISFEMEGAKLYDRRKDTTAGGSGSHRANDPATWEVSSNPAVALDHYLLGRYTGSIKTFGVGLAASDVPYAEFAALANLCDEDVAKKAGGTQNRYEASGFLFADRSYSDTIRDLCRAMNARPADFGGRIGIIDGEEKTPVLTIEDGDVIEGVPEAYNPKRSWADLVSVVRGSYQNPAQLYQAAEYPRITDAAWTAADGGSPKEATLDLEMETDPERAQRLATLFALRERRQAQLSGTYSLRTIELEQGDWFIRSGGIFGTSPGKVFEVIDRVLDPRTMTVTLTAFEVDASDSAWDETTAIDPPPAPIPSTDELEPMEVPDLTVTGITLTGTAAQLPAIRVQWVEPEDTRVQQIVIEAVPEAGGVPTSAQVDWATGQVVFTNGITDDTDYLVRAKFVGDFIPSEWTSNFEVTTLGDYSVGAATTVPWSGVTGAGRPDDNADVTGDNTAAAIVGQGALATLPRVTLGTGGLVRREDGTTNITDATAITALGTAAAITGQGALATLGSAPWATNVSGRPANLAALSGSEGINNALVPVGVNQLVDHDFRFAATYWRTLSSAGSVAAATNETLGIRRRTLTGTGVTIGGTIQLDSFPDMERFACRAGDVVEASGFAAQTNCSAVRVQIAFHNAAGTTIGTSALASFTPGGSTASLADFTRLSVIATAPANTAYARIIFTAVSSTTAPVLHIAKPMLAIANSGQTAPSAWNPGLDNAPGADVTAANTAAAIVGQGTGATADSLADLNATDDQTARARIVEDFTRDGYHWTTAFGGAPGAQIDPAGATYATVANVGRVIRLAPVIYLQPKGALRPAIGRRYLVAVDLIATEDVTGGSMRVNLFMNGLSSAWAHGPASYSSSTPVGAIALKDPLAVADGLVQIAHIFTCTAIGANDAAWRPRLDLLRPSGTGGVIEIRRFRVFDVTDIPVGRVMTQLLRADGTTPVTEAAVVTGLGTAAAITGQGPGATAVAADVLNDALRVSSLFNARLPDRPAVAADFTGSTGSGTPASIAALATGTIANVANEGDVRQFTDNTALSHRGWLPIVSGNTYRIRVRARVTVNGTSNQLFAQFVSFNAAGTVLSAHSSGAIEADFVAADGWIERELTITGATILAAQPTTAFIRARVLGGRNTGGAYSGATWQVAWLRLEEATEAIRLATVETGANVTETRTAAAITGQGPGATAAAAAVLNSYVPQGVNVAVNGTFDLGDIAWTSVAGTPGAIVLDSANAYSSQSYYYTAAADGSHRAVNSNIIPVVPGEYLRLAAAVRRMVAGTGGSCQVRIRYQTAAGVFVSVLSVTFTTNDTYSLLSAIGAVPATAARAEIDILASSVTGGRRYAVGLVFVERLTVAGTNLISSSGTLLGDTAIITASGTAAAITGQGNQALANAARGNTASRPASSGGYGWYANTQTGFLQLDVPSVGWVDVAGIPVASFVASYSASPINDTGSGASFSTATININTTGGTGPYAYFHELVTSNTLTPKAFISGATAGSFTIQAAGFAVSENENGQIRSTVVDANGKVSIILQAYSMTRTS